MRTGVVWLSQSGGKRRWRVYIGKRWVLSIPLRRVRWLKEEAKRNA